MQVQTSPAEARHGARGERKGTPASIFLSLRLTFGHRGRCTRACAHIFRGQSALRERKEKWRKMGPFTFIIFLLRILTLGWFGGVEKKETGKNEGNKSRESEFRALARAASGFCVEEESSGMEARRLCFSRWLDARVGDRGRPRVSAGLPRYQAPQAPTVSRAAGSSQSGEGPLPEEG